MCSLECITFSTALIFLKKSLGLASCLNSDVNVVEPIPSPAPFSDYTCVTALFPFSGVTTQEVVWRSVSDPPLQLTLAVSAPTGAPSGSCHIKSKLFCLCSKPLLSDPSICLVLMLYY